MVFSPQKIYLVIALTLLALVGILVVQFFWVDAAVDAEKSQFDREFSVIAQDLRSDIESDSLLQKPILTYISEAPGQHPDSLSEEKNAFKAHLRTTIDSVFNRNKMDIEYEFGLVLHEPGCRDGAEQEEVLFSTMSAQNSDPILNTKYKTCNCVLNDQAHINFYFPNKSFFIAKQIGWMLGLSILCILIVVGCFVFTIMTIRRQKRLAEMKNDFINNMTHEFKTPIFSISLASKAIRKIEEIQESPKLKKYLNLIDDENKRLKDQVNKVLQMALVDASESRLNKEEVDIHRVIKDVASSFDLKLEEQGGAINFQLNADKHLIKADETHLSNIFRSLIDNAIKYSEEQPEIVISTRDKEDGVCFSIADNGIGMDSQTQEHIFDKFYRAQSGDRHDVKGFGLGLSYVKNIVEAHQGWIKLKSKVNKGSTFTIFLPA